MRRSMGSSLAAEKITRPVASSTPATASTGQSPLVTWRTKVPSAA